MIATLARFWTALTLAFTVQIAALLLCSWIWGDARQFFRIYSPFEGVAAPLLQHFFGKSDGSLGYHILGTALIGALTYSMLVGLLAMCFIRRRK